MFHKTFLITNIFGRLNDGQANNKARAGHVDIPFAIKACIIGISVSVEKYIKAPNSDAIKFHNTVFCHTTDCIVLSGKIGIINPAINTQINNSGKSILENHQVSKSRSFLLSLSNLKILIHIISSITIIINIYFNVLSICNQFIINMDSSKKKKDINDFCDIFDVFCSHKDISFWSDFSLKIKAILNQTSIAINMDATILAIPIWNQSTDIVRKIAAIFIAGPANKNVTAGPSPAHLFLIHAKRGSIVQEHTAKIIPDTEAIQYETIFLDLCPKYLSTLSFLINTAIAHAINNAGTRHVSTCSLAYSCNKLNADKIADINQVDSIGKK